MNVRRIAAVAAVGVVAAGAYAPAVAAPKPKPFAGSYTLTLMPDPTPNGFNNIPGGPSNCFTVNPGAADKRDLAVPRAGKLQVVLDSPQTTPAADWDLYVLDKAGEALAESTSEFSHEEVSVKLKSAATVTIAVCNLTGSPDGKVTYKLV